MGATITVRVVPRAGRTAVERRGGELIVRVRAAPEHGRATAEAAAAIASALAVPKGAVRLRVGPRSRVKVFAVDGLTQKEADRRLDPR